jgi:signal transduction histidine kinase
VSAAPDARIAVRERVLLDLAKCDKSNPHDTFRSVTEGAALALDVPFVRIWRLLPDRGALVCEDLFIRDEQRHAQGEELRAHDHPVYFEHLLRAPLILADDVRVDPRTRDLAADVLAPHDIASRMDVPIWHRGTLFGIMSHEQPTSLRHWRDDEAAFAGNLADVISATVDAAERHAFETRWASVIDGVAELVLVLDEQGTIVQASPRSQDWLEHRFGGPWFTLGERSKHLEYRELSGRVVPYTEWPANRALRGEQVHVVHGVWNLRGDFIGYFRVIMKPIVEDGRVAAVLCLLTDVTKDIEFDSLKDELLAALGRELETPITSIRKDAALAACHAHEPAWRGKLDAIGRAATRMERLIEDLVEISNVRRGTLCLNPEPVDLHELITSQIHVLRATVPGRTIRIASPGMTMVIGDHRRLGQVVRRLVTNAIRYSPHGGEIEVKLFTDEHDALISVRDHGVGISADKQPQIFNIFFRAHARTTHDYGGLGIGLYLSREIARLHGGELWFESIEGRGSTFYLRIPRGAKTNLP